MAPLVSQLVHAGWSSAVAYPQNECFADGVRFARCEGIMPAPEAIARDPRGRVEVEAARADEEGVERTILFNLCGHGHFDLSAPTRLPAGRLVDHELPQAELDEAAAVLAGMPGTG